MKALILAAGYATRLYPLTRDRAKPLLPVGGRPIIDYIVDSLESVAEIDRVYVVTNEKFTPSFRRWASEREGRLPIEVINDGTTSDDDKKGAIGDILFTIDRVGIDDDLLVVGGDNLFDLDMKKVVESFRRKGTTVVAYDIGDRDAARRYGIVATDADGRIVDFREKPEDPPSTLAATALYLFPREGLGLFRTYAAEGNNLDQPGRYIQWLYRKEPVYAHVFDGLWYDIGNIEMYRRADELYREKRGKQERGFGGAGA